MGRFDVHGFEGLLAKLDKLGRFEEVAPKMMEAGMDVLEEEFIAEASRHKDTGEMVASIKRTGVTASTGGSYYICTRPTGYASKRKWKNARKGKGEGRGRRKVRNMEKLVWLEYGVKGRPATPVVKPVIIRAGPKVVKDMSEVYQREVGTL